VKILALSDIGRWSGCERLVERYKPDVVVLPGDLTSDGSAAFWSEGLELVPEFRKQRGLLYRKIRDAKQFKEKCVICEEAAHNNGPFQRYDGKSRHFRFLDHLRQLEIYYQKTKAFAAFAAAHTRIHFDRFYRFLKYAGNRSIVLVTKGDHDNDFEGDYDPERINKIPGCREISGKLHLVGRSTFLGLGFEQAGYRIALRRLVGPLRGRADVVIAHVPQQNLRLVAELRPRLLIRGHYGAGEHLVDGVPSVFTTFEYFLVDLPDTGVPQFQVVGCHPFSTASRSAAGTIVRSRTFGIQSPACRQRAAAACASLRKTYPWLKPFPEIPSQ
jgi:hypothetical protein